MAIKVCQLHIYRTASLHLCYQFSDLHLCYYLCKIKYSHAASYMIVKITQNIALQGNMSCSILRSLFSYQLHHTAYYYMLKHVIAFLVLFVWVEALPPSQQFFSHVETEPPLPGYYQYFLGGKCILLKDTTRRPD